MRSKTLSVDSSEKAKRRRSKNDLRENLRGWGILGPIILYYFIFGIVPMIILFRYSFLEDDLFKGTVFVGFDNFVSDDPEVLRRVPVQRPLVGSAAHERHVFDREIKVIIVVLGHNGDTPG